MNGKFEFDTRNRNLLPVNVNAFMGELN